MGCFELELYIQLDAVVDAFLCAELADVVDFALLALVLVVGHNDPIAFSELVVHALIIAI